MPLEPLVERVNEASNRTKWTKALVRLLGRITDRELAARAGVSRSAVSSERRRRGIPPARRRRADIEWTAAMIAVLGTDSDRCVAAALGLNRGSVAEKRRFLGIPSFYPPPHDKFVEFPWTGEQLALLGRMTDAEVAKRIGATRAIVTKKRRLRGISPYRPPARRIRWTRKLLAALGKRTDAEVAAEHGISVPSVKRKRVAMGVAPFHEKRNVARTAKLRRILALPPSVAQQKTGLKYDTIKKMREELGIEALLLRDISWTPEALARLGKAPDQQLAEELRLAHCTVRLKRRALGIPPYRRWQRWTDEEIAQLDASIPVEELARKLDRPIGSVKLKMYQLGLL